MGLDALVIDAWLDLELFQDEVGKVKESFLSLLLALEDEAPIVTPFVVFKKLSSLDSFLLLYLKDSFMMKFYDGVLDCK